MLTFSNSSATKYNKVVRTTKPIHAVAEKSVGLENKQVKSRPKVKPKYSEQDLLLLSKAIYAEAGSDWISDLQQQMVGQVVLNRVQSDLFPDTIYDVLHQKGQYQFIIKKIEIKPNQRAIKNAKLILNGKKVCPENVVYQSEFRQGDGVYKKFKTKYSTTYFCYLNKA